jgi:hypothetical protein
LLSCPSRLSSVSLLLSTCACGRRLSQTQESLLFKLVLSPPWSPDSHCFSGGEQKKVWGQYAEEHSGHSPQDKAAGATGSLSFCWLRPSLSEQARSECQLALAAPASAASPQAGHRKQGLWHISDQLHWPRDVDAGQSNMGSETLALPPPGLQSFPLGPQPLPLSLFQMPTPRPHNAQRILDA